MMYVAGPGHGGPGLVANAYLEGTYSKVRVANVVDLMRLQPPAEHPNGLSDRDFGALLTTDKPIIFAFHGYPWLIHRLTYRRTNHKNLHVRRYKEEGTTTTPFDMAVMNDLDRIHPVADVIDRIPLRGSPRQMHCRIWRRHAADQSVEVEWARKDRKGNGSEISPIRHRGIRTGDTTRRARNSSWNLMNFLSKYAIEEGFLLG